MTKEETMRITFKELVALALLCALIAGGTLVLWARGQRLPSR